MTREVIVKVRKVECNREYKAEREVSRPYRGNHVRGTIT
jgi:hypothetical protein